jgi:hypothetical protein
MSGHDHDTGSKSKPAMENLLFGLFLLGLAALLFFGTRKLSAGTAHDMGPAYFPRALAWGQVIFGTFLVGKSLMTSGDKVLPPNWRGLLLVPAAVGLFAFLVNTAGLALASFLSMLLVSLASKETRPLEILIFSAAMSAGAVLLFVKALSLPVPIFPW